MLFNERLKQDLALIVNTPPAPGTTNLALEMPRDQMQQQQQQTSSGLNTSVGDSNRVSSRLRSRTTAAVHNEMPYNSSSSFSTTTTVTSPSSFSYNLRSHSSSSSFFLSSTSVSSSSKLKNKKKNNFNTSSSSSLLIRTLKHSFNNHSLNNQK